MQCTAAPAKKMDYECNLHMHLAIPKPLTRQNPRKSASQKNRLHTKDIFDYIAGQEFMRCRQSATGPAGDSVNAKIAAAQANG
jgi:hypothetical protein